jgi:hypothetical protein
MRVKVFIGLVFLLLAGCWVANGQTIIGRPLKPLSSSFTPPTPPLDSITNVYGAYSFARKLRTAYGGSAFQITDGTNTQDVGFTVLGITDTNTVATFAGANTVWVSVVYDQTTAGRPLDVTPAVATNRPIAMTGGALILDSNGFQAAYFHSVNTFIKDDTLNAVPAGSVITVFTALSNSDDNVIAAWGSSSQMAILQGTGTILKINDGLVVSGPSYSLDTQSLAFAFFASGGGTDGIILNNGSASTGAAGNANANTATLGGNGNAAIQYSSEFYVANGSWESDPQRTQLQDNINAFYSIW